MIRVFADTAFYIALLNPCGNLHGIAHEISRTLRVYVTTTEYVLVELAGYFGHFENRALLFEFGNRSRANRPKKSRFLG